MHSFLVLTGAVQKYGLDRPLLPLYDAMMMPISPSRSLIRCSTSMRYDSKTDRLSARGLLEVALQTAERDSLSEHSIFIYIHFNLEFFLFPVLKELAALSGILHSEVHMPLQNSVRLCSSKGFSTQALHARARVEEGGLRRGQARTGRAL